MAINITYSAQTFSPAYNPVEFYFSGSNATKLGYRYIIDVFDTNNNRISRQKVVPQINYQGKIDISRILSNLVTVSFNPTSNQINNASNSYLNYKLSIGEEFIPDVWTYTGITSAPSQYSGVSYVRLNSNIPHSFKAQDQIYVVDNVYTIDGFHTIYSATSPTSISINVVFLNYLTGATSGTVQFADTEK